MIWRLLESDILGFITLLFVFLYCYFVMNSHHRHECHWNIGLCVGTFWGRILVQHALINKLVGLNFSKSKQGENNTFNSEINILT